jgi:hypothetical protein
MISTSRDPCQSLCFTSSFKISKEFNFFQIFLSLDFQTFKTPELVCTDELLLDYLFDLRNPYPTDRSENPITNP